MLKSPHTIVGMPWGSSDRMRSSSGKKHFAGVLGLLYNVSTHILTWQSTFGDIMRNWCSVPIPSNTCCLRMEKLWWIYVMSPPLLCLPRSLSNLKELCDGYSGVWSVAFSHDSVRHVISEFVTCCSFWRHLWWACRELTLKRKTRKYICFSQSRISGTGGWNMHCFFIRLISLRAFLLTLIFSAAKSPTKCNPCNSLVRLIAV